MLEIYNEQVRDLLQKENPKGGLPVRQNPKLGLFFVQGLKFVPVGSYAEIEKRIEQGIQQTYINIIKNTLVTNRYHLLGVIAVTIPQCNSIPSQEAVLCVECVC